jgi:hypothetical protein
MNRIIAVAVVAAALLVPTGASAAAPDGAGPWADTVVDFEQGLRKNGTPVLPERSNPTAALGEAERTNAVGTFFSLGFGGQITLGYDNNVCNGSGADLDLELVETTNEPYADELVDVYVSKDGVTYTKVADDVNKDAMIGLPPSITVARYVRVVDVTNPANTPDTFADGYDVDGVRALNTNCTDLGKMTGGGVFGSDEGLVTHGFVLHCDPSKLPNQLVVVWAEKRKVGYKKGKPVYELETHQFKLQELTSALCSDDPAIDEKPPVAGFDTYKGEGTGKLDHESGATASWEFTDAGEPGRNDRVKKLVIRDADGNVVLDVESKLCLGNHQAHPGHP